MTNAVSINNLTFCYGDKATLANVNLNFEAGKFTLLTGPSGSGKSTLLRLIARLLPKYGGKITGGTIKISDHMSVGMMFQHPATQFALDTPRHEMQFALENMQIAPNNIPEKIEKALTFCGISQLADRKLVTLSGGEQQRVALAEIICMDVNIILLDEPFASVDERHRQFLLASLVKLQRQKGKTIILADHDLHGYQHYADTILVCRNQHVIIADKNMKQNIFTKADSEAAAIKNIRLAMPNTNDNPQLTLRNFKITRGGRRLISVNNFSFYKGHVTLLTGETGVGKSTLISACSHLTDYEGIIEYQNKPSEKIRPRTYAQLVATVFQNASDQFLNVTVGEEIALSKKNGHNDFFTSAQLNDAINLLGLENMEKRVVYSLSGGQQKKLQILIMLMMGQPTLLMDEPFTGLDHDSCEKVISLINQSRKTYPQTIIIVSHQLNGLQKLVDYHVRLKNSTLSYEEGLA